MQLYARPLRTLFLLGSLALWTLFFLTIRARRRRAEIFYRRKCHSFPYQFTDFFFFGSCKVEQSSLSRFLIEELLTSSKSSVLIYVIPSLSSKLCVSIDSETRFLLNSYSTSPTSISTLTSSSLSLATTSDLRLTRFDYWQSSLLRFGLIVT